MEFPHLNDTRFPNFDNVNVYSYQNEFDYTRWVPNTKVTLTNVLWNSDYNDVVKFDTNIQRDRWFDDKTDGYEVTLTTNHTLPPEGGIKLPIPFDVASRYNYLFVDIPVMTSSQRPIEYEDQELGIRRWYFFVDTVSSRAPNTTMFNLSLDVWTQFHNDVEIKYMFLERGHAPVAATDTDTYLANPIANNDYLLTPDVTPTGTSIVRKSTYIPFGSGEKWVCIALPMSVSALEGIGQVTENDDYKYGTITYSDTSARNGYQLQVNGFGMGNGNDYSSLRTRTQPNFCASAHHRIQNDVLVYALPAASVHDPVGNIDKFFIAVQENCPNLFNAIQGVFVVDREMLNLGDEVTVAGHTLYMVSGTDQTIDIEPLRKSDFKYPTRYQRFAKLYTFPYAELLLTDNEGEQITVRIEDTTTMHAHNIAEIAFPFLRMRTFFDGIGGTGSQTYTWKLLNGNDSTARIYNGDWFEHCFDHDIPCYAVYMDGETAWYLDNFNTTIRAGRQNALVNYHNTVRNANTMRENALDMDATNHDNSVDVNETERTNARNLNETNRTNARATNETNRTNARATNDTNETNARNSATTAYGNQTDLDATTASNQIASNNTMYTNADADASTLATNTTNTVNTTRANTDATIANNAAKTEFANTTSNLVTSTNADKSRAEVNAANLASVVTLAAESETTASLAHNNGLGAVLGGAGGAALAGGLYAFMSSAGASAAAGAAAGGAAGSVAPGIGNLAGAAGGAAVGALVGLVSSGASWGASSQNVNSIVQGNQASVDASIDSNTSSLNATINNNSSVTTLLNGERTYNTTHDNDLLDANTDRSNANLTNNNANTATTMRNNANRSRNTGNANATAYQNTMDNNALNTRDTAYINADNTHVTADANADRTRDTGNANADRTRDTGNAIADNTRDTANGVADAIKSTSDANATYVRNTTIQNAKETLANARNSAQYSLYDARLRGPRQVGSYAGDPTADYMRTRGVQVKVRTMPDSDVRQVGDWFSRYGYALNQIWDVETSGLCPMNHFCYWKCRDVWVDDRKSSNNAAVTLIETMLQRGVTVWNNPDEVGRVSVYDN